MSYSFIIDMNVAEVRSMPKPIPGVLTKKRHKGVVADNIEVVDFEMSISSRQTP